MKKNRYPAISSFDEMMAIIKKDKKGDELVVVAKSSTRNDIIFNLLTEEDWNVADSISNSSKTNRWYLFQNKNITVSINSGEDDFYEDVVINFNNVA